MNPFAFLDGYKTYLAGLGLIGLGIFQCTQGDLAGGSKALFEGFAVMSGRQAIQKLAGR